MGITAKISGDISLTDSLTGSVSLQKPLNNSYSGTLETYGQQVIVGTASTTVTLPINPVEFVYLKNLSATSGTTITATWTPTGGASATVLTLDPGALIIFAETTATNGISAFSLTSNQAGTPVEFILCG